MNLQRIWGVQLPSIRHVFKRGMTSVLYSAEDGLIVYTIEPIKLDWWQHLGLIADYRQEGVYHCEGYDRQGYHVERDLPLFCCAGVPVLQHANKNLWQIMHEVTVKKREVDLTRWWERLSKSRYPQIKQAALWLQEQPVDFGMIYPDYKKEAFLYLDSRHSVCIDPFHDLRLDKWLKLERTP